jgi:uncharacterized protein involved in exopolysaccharide biosynthesis
MTDSPKKDIAMDNQYLKSSSDAQDTGIRDYLAIIFKHKTKIIAVFLSIVVVVTVASFLLPPTYEAESSILVKIGREYMNRSEVGADKSIISLNQAEMTNSEIQILTNRDLIKKVVTKLRVETIYPKMLVNLQPGDDPLETAVEKFSKALTVEGVQKSSVIQVSFQHRDPKVAALAVNTLVEFYKEKHLQVFSDPKSSFLEKQLSDYEQKLQASETSLQKFKQEHRVFSLEDQRKLLLDQRTGLDTSLKTAENSISELQKKIVSLRAQMKRISENGASYTSTERDRIIVEAKSRLLSLQIEEQELLKKYTENNYLVVNMRKEIRMVTNFLKEQEDDISRKVKPGNTVYQNVELELIRAEADFSSQKAKAATLRRQLGQLDGEIQALDYREKDMQQLKREQAINEKNYQTYADKTEEARIADDMNRLKLANISVIDVATVPVQPVKPKKALNIALGIVFGALAGLGLAFLSEHSTQSFSTPQSVEQRLGLQVLAAIPYKEG